VTERDDFWARESQTIDFVHRTFPNADKVLSLHQAYPAAASRPRWQAAVDRLRGREMRTAQALHEHARRRGFRLFAPQRIEQCWELYEASDLHVGSRLHAHLYFLRQAKRSFLSYVDERCVGISRALDFPLCDPADWNAAQDHDFERTRLAARSCHRVMAQFVSSLQERLS
jgi:hypothetical protein